MGIGFREIVIILVIVLLVFGTKKLKTIGSDLGSAVKGFKKAMGEGEEEQKGEQQASKQIGGPEEKDADFPESTAGQSREKNGKA